ncbi:hypothetical protein A3D77_00560 [Candidatus Gottesmanbacteria bacterium RIFCSPHIGHO2_02_FULL_39_11]|uniref:Uncharacterized protein n=1 Tax=Candidatus Gottesmanbacteria bacterium RIFCSPHIGHO2_02_FULL_39_11 TaxID=1798382 RepID=A0A1F5ZL65_9BACT|nr:MAG: hypothetical protein A3D77_00560 [Candidatus Gottesmanbacteria bacterium RIFCSPHIGHO2_02_FULL_39_11]
MFSIPGTIITLVLILPVLALIASTSFPYHTRAYAETTPVTPVTPVDPTPTNAPIPTTTNTPTPTAYVPSPTLTPTPTTFIPSVTPRPTKAPNYHARPHLECIHYYRVIKIGRKTFQLPVVSCRWVK